MSISKNRPIVLIANSSWYLSHYRELLIKDLKKDNYLITISPFDEYTSKLEKISLNFLWRIQKAKEANPFIFIKSLLRIVILAKAIKPKLIHSHTIKANLITAFAAFCLDLPNVLSFTGLGRLLKGNMLSRLFLRIILQVIFFLSNHKLSRGFIKKSNGRGFFIFQNPLDLNYFHENIDKDKNYKYKLIYGSGIPGKYFNAGKIKNKWEKIYNGITKEKPKVSLIFCGRLLKSKGISLFIELSKSSTNLDSYIFGGRKINSKEYLSLKEINSIKRNFSNINFMGVVKDPLLELKKEFPILIVPSLYGEGISRSILEALCLGIPVICSKNACSGVFNERSVYISKSDNIEEYAKCIKDIIQDAYLKILRDKLLVGKNMCINLFKEEEIVNQTKNVYSELIKL